MTLVLVCACTVTSSPPQAGPTHATAGPPSGGASTAPGASGAPAVPGQTLSGTAPQAFSYPDSGAVGAMATSYLRGSPARSLVVEVDWMSGRKPAASSLTHVEAILRRELAKPDGISVRLGAEMDTTRTTWSGADVLAAEREFRRERSSGMRATMWVAFVGGSLADAPSALGAAFTASAALIFRDRIGDATSAVLLASEIERAVLTHEVGHLLGLVNIAYRSSIDHEDPSHPKHSKNPDSVMYWAVEDLSVRNVLAGGPPDDFDAADRADLAAVRAA